MNGCEGLRSPSDASRPAARVCKSCGDAIFDRPNSVFCVQCKKPLNMSDVALLMIGGITADSDTGSVYRNGRPVENKPLGNGYSLVRVCGVRFSMHRIVWTMFRGDIPDGMHIDHINGIRSDNRLANLGCVTPSVNGQNQRRAMSTNRIGLLGVSKKRRKFEANIKLDGRSIYIGTFASAEEAHQAYLQKKREIHEGCTI